MGYASNHILYTIAGRIFSPVENSESVGGFVAEQDIRTLLNMIQTLFSVYCINDSRLQPENGLKTWSVRRHC